MKIKIPPYPNYRISENAISDVESQSVKKTDSNGLSNQLVMIVKFKDGEERVIRSRPVRHLDNLYVSAFPNPVHLFLSVAIEHFNQSEEIKNTNFPKCGKQIADDIYILDIEENGTHECYNHYIKYRSSSIVMLVAALEAFMNHIIPNDYQYITQRTKNKISKKVVFPKKKIESGAVTFNEKLDSLIPKMLNNDSFWADLEPEQFSIKELYRNRKNIIHLKTNAEDDLSAYFNVIDEMLDLDIFSCVDAITKFMNAAKKDFVKFEE